jgi:hypothetical protein
MTAVLIGSVYWLFALQLDKTVASLTQLQEEHAEVTHLLIEAKVDNAERKGKQASARTAPMAVQPQFPANAYMETWQKGCTNTSWYHAPSAGSHMRGQRTGTFVPDFGVSCVLHGLHRSAGACITSLCFDNAFSSPAFTL